MNILICRIGAIGDTIITTPLIKSLSEAGHSVFCLTSESGIKILDNNPYVKKSILHVKDSIPNDLLGEYFKSVAQAHECEKYIDLCESIEVNLALHPSDPRYKYPRFERQKLCDKNYYEETIRIAEEQTGLNIFDYENGSYIPSMFFTKEEQDKMRGTFDELRDSFVTVIGLSGSSRNKAYPYYCELIQSLNSIHPNLKFITVGDESCQILEVALKQIPNVIPMSGLWSIRQSILSTQFADCVISPDTGLLHGAGCFDTPKIALLNATTHENITKHFNNVFPIEAKVSCCPCFYIIYDADNQCPIGRNKAPLCMDIGIPVSEVINKFNLIYSSFNNRRIILEK